MSKRVVTAMLMVLAGAVAANCGDDSEGSSSGDAGMGPGGSGTIADAGEGPGSAATSNGGMPGLGDAGSSADAGAGTTPGGAPTSGGAAVGGAGGAGGADGNCPASIVDFPTAFAEAVCRKRVECCQNDTETCMTELTAAMDDVFPGLAQAGLDGAATGNCQALELCVAAIDAADCADWPKELGTLYGVPVGAPACRDIVQGTLAPAAECVSNYQCDNGYCLDAAGGAASMACVALVADGQPCDNDSVCNLSTSFCANNGTCTARRPNGMVCTTAAQCQSRICDTADTDTCVAPGAAQCEYVPEGCSLGRRPVRDSRGWPLLVVALVLGAGMRRRARRD